MLNTRIRRNWIWTNTKLHWLQPWNSITFMYIIKTLYLNIKLIQMLFHSKALLGMNFLSSHQYYKQFNKNKHKFNSFYSWISTQLTNVTRTLILQHKININIVSSKKIIKRKNYNRKKPIVTNCKDNFMK